MLDWVSYYGDLVLWHGNLETKSSLVFLKVPPSHCWSISDAYTLYMLYTLHFQWCTGSLWAPWSICSHICNQIYNYNVNCVFSIKASMSCFGSLTSCNTPVVSGHTVQPSLTLLIKQPWSPVTLSLFFLDHFWYGLILADQKHLTRAAVLGILWPCHLVIRVNLLPIHSYCYTFLCSQLINSKDKMFTCCIISLPLKGTKLFVVTYVTSW